MFASFAAFCRCYLVFWVVMVCLSSRVIALLKTFGAVTDCVSQFKESDRQIDCEHNAPLLRCSAFVAP